MIKNYFKIAWRNLARNKIYTVINIAGLSLGIISCLIIYLISSFELSYDNFHKDKEQIFRLVASAQKQDGDKQYASSVPNPVAATIRKEFTGVDAVTVFHNFYSRVNIPGTNKLFEAPRMGSAASDIIVTDPAYFSIIQYKWLAGNPSSFEKPFNVILAETKAQKYFGVIPPGEMIGKEIIYSDSLRLTVSGIVEDFGKNSDFIFKDFISFNTVQQSFLKDRFNLDNWHNMSPVAQTFIKLSKGSTVSQIQKQLDLVAKKQMYAGPDFKISMALQPLSSIHFDSLYTDAYGRRAHLPTLYGLIGIALFILLIAAINFINLSTAQSLQRSKEIGIRKVLGSRRTGLIIQFLGETFMLTFFAMIVSFVLMTPLLSAFQSFIPDGVSFHYNATTLVFVFFIVIITSLLAGLYPAKVLSSYEPALSLKGAVLKQGNQKNYLRKSLIVFQFTISLVFIICSLVIGKQINYMLTTDMGFVKDAIITIPTSYEYPKEKKDALVNQVKKLTGVQMVSAGIGTPIEKKHSLTYIACRAISDKEVAAEYQTGDENYISLYQLKLKAGRNLLSSDTMKEFLINETCARQLGFSKPEDAIGQIADIGFSESGPLKKAPIVGVVADFHSQSLHEIISPTFITSSSNLSRVITVKLSSHNKEAGDFTKTIAQIEKLWHGVYPTDKFSFQFFDEAIAALYEKEQKTEKIMNAAMAIAIFVSAIGLFGLATFTARQRTKEIGIRKVVGADISNIIFLLSADFLRPVIVSIFIASPIAYFLIHRWLQDFVYRIDISGWTFVIAGLVALLIALITVSFHSFKAARANPVKSLRIE